MWKIIGTLLLSVAFSPAAEAQEESDPMPGIKADCEAEWSGDFAMQEYCIGRQVDAYNALVPIWNDETNEQLRSALQRCYQDWQTANGRDWAMVEYCYGRQEEAYQRLSGG